MWKKITDNEVWIQIPHSSLRKYTWAIGVLSQHLCLPFTTKTKQGSAYPFLFSSQKCKFLQKPDRWLITSPNLSRNSLGTVVWDRKMRQLEPCTGQVPASVTSISLAGSPHAYKDHKTNITQRRNTEKNVGGRGQGNLGAERISHWCLMPGMWDLLEHFQFS